MIAHKIWVLGEVDSLQRKTPQALTPVDGLLLGAGNATGPSFRSKLAIQDNHLECVGFDYISRPQKPLLPRARAAGAGSGLVVWARSRTTAKRKRQLNKYRFFSFLFSFKRKRKSLLLWGEKKTEIQKVDTPGHLDWENPSAERTINWVQHPNSDKRSPLLSLIRLRLPTRPGAQICLTARQAQANSAMFSFLKEKKKEEKKRKNIVALYSSRARTLLLWCLLFWDAPLKLTVPFFKPISPIYWTGRERRCRTRLCDLHCK